MFLFKKTSCACFADDTSLNIDNNQVRKFKFIAGLPCICTGKNNDEFDLSFQFDDQQLIALSTLFIEKILRNSDSAQNRK